MRKEKAKREARFRASEYCSSRQQKAGGTYHRSAGARLRLNFFPWHQGLRLERPWCLHIVRSFRSKKGKKANTYQRIIIALQLAQFSNFFTSFRIRLSSP